MLYIAHLTSILSSYAGINCDASSCNIFELFKNEATACYRQPNQTNPAARCKPTVCWGDWSKGIIITQWVGVDQSNDAGGVGLLLHLLPSDLSFVFKIARRELQQNTKDLANSYNSYDTNLYVHSFVFGNTKKNGTYKSTNS